MLFEIISSTLILYSWNSLFFLFTFSFKSLIPFCNSSIFLFLPSKLLDFEDTLPPCHLSRRIYYISTKSYNSKTIIIFSWKFYSIFHIIYNYSFTKQIQKDLLIFFIKFYCAEWYFFKLWTFGNVDFTRFCEFQIFKKMRPLKRAVI